MSDRLSPSKMMHLPDGNSSFSGTDFHIDYISESTDGTTRSLNNVQTISVSTKTTLIPVRRLGEKSPKDYVRCHRTVAGTMIFLLLGNDPFVDELIYSKAHVDRRGAYEFRPLYIENIPKFDLILSAVHEVPDAITNIPQTTKMMLSGIHLAESGTTISVHDIYTEIMYTYVAEWIVPFTNNVAWQDVKKLWTPNSDEEPLSQSSDILYKTEAKSKLELPDSFPDPIIGVTGEIATNQETVTIDSPASLSSPIELVVT